MLTLIGNSPSSGSTFLADLLDSTPTTACGVELNLFSNRLLYEDFEKYKDQVKKNFPILSIYSSGIINFNRLHNYGLSEDELISIIQSSNSFNEFIDIFEKKYLALRGKKFNSQILFEKTPQNVNVIKEFLDEYKEGYFISIVRNPIYIYSSLLKRGMSSYIALNTWLIDISRVIKYKSHPRLIVIKYEDLVENPYKITSDIIQKISGVSYEPNDIEKNYLSNNFRKYYSKKIESWTISEYGKIQNANKKDISSEQIQELSILKDTKINSEYANIHDLPEITFVEALKEFGYLDKYKQCINQLDSDKVKKRNLDQKRLVSKYLKEINYNFFKLDYNKFKSHLNPIGLNV